MFDGLAGPSGRKPHCRGKFLTFSYCPSLNSSLMACLSPLNPLFE